MYKILDMHTKDNQITPINELKYINVWLSILLEFQANVKDTIAPLLTLNKYNSEDHPTVERYSTFEDPKATAVDSHFGTISEVTVLESNKRR